MNANLILYTLSGCILTLKANDKQRNASTAATETICFSIIISEFFVVLSLKNVVITLGGVKEDIKAGIFKLYYVGIKSGL